MRPHFPLTKNSRAKEKFKILEIFHCRSKMSPYTCHVKQQTQTVMRPIYDNIARILESNQTTAEKISELYEAQSRHAATKHISSAAWFAYLRAIKSLQA